MKNILIPMSGRGQRFRDAGHSLPKPLIDVNGKPMIQRVVDNIGIEGKYIFLVLKEHYDQLDLKTTLPDICKKNHCEIVVVDKITEGAACTCLLAEHLINNNDELIIANSDQLVEWKIKDFFAQMEAEIADGGILTFAANDPKWSFARLKGNTNIVEEVAEKKPISDRATAGVYWFKNGKSFVRGAKQMIEKNIRTNNEFYVCPVFNELIINGAKIVEYPINSMIGLGTPEDLQKYLNG